jgi:hypothetical protein
MKSVNCSKPAYTSITYSKIEHIHYNLIFTTNCNDSFDFNYDYFMGYLNLSLTNEYVCDLTIPAQVIKNNQCQSDCSIHFKLNYTGIFLLIVALLRSIDFEE